MSEQEEGVSGKQVIARAASVLKALENQRAGLTVSEISRASGLPRTTVHRLVSSLEAQQFVISTADGVRLGPALVRLAASAHTDIIGIARPFIEALGRTTRETVDLCVYRGHHSVLVDQYPSDRELRVVSAVGTAFPIHCTAHGKAILAELPEDLLDSLLDRRLEKRATNTIDDRKRLHDELDAVRERGFAIDTQEHAEGVYGIGVFLKTGLSDHYAIAVAVPQLRFEGESEQIIHALLKCKVEIESILRRA
ncbi:IclR family transcriptional regulator [Pseudomonas nabeulensis]|uniref:IclR family transcriptional regulator n=1 Tax=Pseudomonas nabeulensis TaxID=2293833 RepID=A0A4Z0AP54_9PSED|nr:IclR family transcriptional regulator [Pseudomonas nabeulensis]TFY87728.1 IclR family transcriptional regulator [Pseudomonas nabeulensis]